MAACNSLIDKNRHRIEKQLLPVLSDGDTVIFHSAPSTESEAEWISSKIKELHEGGTALRDITILYRAHYVTRPVEEALLRQKLSYRIYSGVPFFGRAEIKDALCYLRMVVSQDDLSFRRIVNTPKRNIGRRRMAFL